MTAIQQARYSFEAVKQVLTKGEINEDEIDDFFNHFKVFNKLEMDRVSQEKTDFLRKLNNFCYEHLRSRNHFSCCGCINRFVGPSYYKQLEKRIHQELREQAEVELITEMFLALYELNIFSYMDGEYRG